MGLPTTSTKTSSQESVIIIDDEQSLLDSIESFLTNSGYRVSSFTDPLRALDALKNQTYDTLLLDIMMPKLDGVKVLKVIRSLEDQKNIQEGKQVKVIMTTALAEKQYVDKTFELGCQAYANKPIDAVKFKEVLEKLALI